MANPKSFDETEVLGTALGVFLRKGYSRTSIADIKKASRLSAGSLYFAFESKQDLFLRVVAFYIRYVVVARIERYIHDQGFFDGVRSYFESTFKNKEYGRCGCLLTITSAEPHLDDVVVRQVKNGFQIIEQEFRRIVQLAQENGEISRKRDPNLIAQHLFTSYQGLLVLVRFGKSDRYLKTVTDAALAYLR